MESVSKAKARLANYPLYLAKCGTQAVTYGKCVGDYMGEVRKNQCSKEFDSLMKCIRNSAKSMGSRL